MKSTRHSYDMGIVGNCGYIAHIDKTGNVVWLCWPRFDSSFLFGGLLDSQKGGEFYVRPAGSDYKSYQEYVENTNILRTVFEDDGGSFELIDFAPRFLQNDRHYYPNMLIRKIRVLSGNPRIVASCKPMGGYGEIVPETYNGSNHINFQGLETKIRLTANISLNHILKGIPFVLTETKYLVLTSGSPFEAPLEQTVEDFYYKTRKYWQNWVKHCSIGNFRQEKVIRSALALKIHQFQDTGAIIAAGTMSLPESNGSTRNWDYRYCWMRDSYYTLNAFTSIGHFEEMERYSHYIENVAASEEGRYQPLYGILGEKIIEEKILELQGYLDNKPVRLGNQAYTHIQNDVYGQVILSILPLYIDNRFPEKARIHNPKLIYHILKMIDETMEEPDAGLWEFRNLAQKHCYTFLFHWAGANAGVQIARTLKDSKMEKIALDLVEKSRKQIEACYNPELKAYTQAIGTKHMDASLLQMITLGYIDPNSELALNHLARLEQELKTKEGLFYRYKHSDDFGVPEVAFLVCAFWYVEALACVGKIPEAVEAFDQLTEYSNSLGLLSEDVDPKNGSQWGNFPQAYSHVGLMNAASRIAKKLDKPDFLKY
ncbi:glycoside hydrolase family 15 protein [Leptospira sp. GIMC2001]|uniref:glycoside hydrolase family 15 protein n=1 Tax=Leptospira sp. GIMC2001 TaxID=1513297 RepID=UPI00234AE0B6|nr:glycoside hydrolase family 15 protein [Leptospira sp. GIMC2001]WCL48330.1 glycoside hydrolase family 15 protein [Leptospira sp. GIMC2001]